MTVNAIVAVCWIDPEAAVTVTVALVGVWIWVDDPPPPHAEINPKPAKIATKRNQQAERRRLQPRKRQIAMARTEVERSFNSFIGVAEAIEAAAMVRTTLVAPFGVTDDGLNEHEVFAGRPEQAKVTAELKPFCGVIVRVIVPCPPEFTVSDAGELPRVKVGGGRLIVNAALATALAE